MNYRIKLMIQICITIASLTANLLSSAQASHQSSSLTITNARSFPRQSFGRTSYPRLQPTGFGKLASTSGQVGRNGLPPTRLDSFVRGAGAKADQIYGDEGYVLPPFDEFSSAHRINTGIAGANDAGLTTGHGSVLPDGWGGDEFVDGPELSRSGSTGGVARHYRQGSQIAVSTQGPIYTDFNASSISLNDPLDAPKEFYNGAQFGTSTSSKFGFSISSF